MHSSSSAVPSVRSLPERLNQECFCITLDRHALTEALEREVGDEALCASFIKARPHLFSNTPVFISERETGEMLRVVRAVEAAFQAIETRSCPGLRRSRGPTSDRAAPSWGTTSISRRPDRS
jgi:hypothetical protein